MYLKKGLIEKFQIQQRITIYITDVNDVKPEFKGTTFQAKINEVGGKNFGCQDILVEEKVNLDKITACSTSAILFGCICLICWVQGLCYQGLVVQSIVSLTSSLRGQLVKCFTTL